MYINDVINKVHDAISKYNSCKQAEAYEMSQLNILNDEMSSLSNVTNEDDPMLASKYRQIKQQIIYHHDMYNEAKQNRMNLQNQLIAMRSYLAKFEYVLEVKEIPDCNNVLKKYNIIRSSSKYAAALGDEINSIERIKTQREYELATVKHLISLIDDALSEDGKQPKRTLRL